VALNRYVLTSTVTITPGSAVAPTPGEPGTGGVAGYGSAATTGGGLYPVTFLAGTPIMLDPAARSSGDRCGQPAALRAGTADMGHAPLAN
jgi:hypothetical protein